jgi:hypothetical protein
MDMKPADHHQPGASSKAEKSGSLNGISKNSSIPSIMVSAAKSHKKMWDAGILLRDSQKEALATLAEYTSIRPLPVESWRQDNGANIESAQSEERESENQTDATYEVAYIYRALAEAETSGTEEDISDVINQQKRLKGILKLCDDILVKLSLVDESLISLQDQHDSVVSKTSAVHSECEKLTAEKSELEGLAKTIQNRLAHYNELENFQRQLTSPNMQVFGLNSSLYVFLLT